MKKNMKPNIYSKVNFSTKKPLLFTGPTQICYPKKSQKENKNNKKKAQKKYEAQTTHQNIKPNIYSTGRQPYSHT